MDDLHYQQLQTQVVAMQQVVSLARVLRTFVRDGSTIDEMRPILDNLDSALAALDALEGH